MYSYVSLQSATCSGNRADCQFREERCSGIVAPVISEYLLFSNSANCYLHIASRRVVYLSSREAQAPSSARKIRQQLQTK